MEWITIAITNFSSKVGSFFDSIWNIISYIRNIIQAIWFAINSFLSMIWDLILKIWDSWIDTNIISAFNYISEYIWWPATVILSSVLILAMFRIFFSFVMKLFKWKIDYSMRQEKIKNQNRKAINFSDKWLFG